MTSTCHWLPYYTPHLLLLGSSSCIILCSPFVLFVNYMHEKICILLFPSVISYTENGDPLSNPFSCKEYELIFICGKIIFQCLCRGVWVHVCGRMSLLSVSDYLTLSLSFSLLSLNLCLSLFLSLDVSVCCLSVCLPVRWQHQE